MSKLKELLIQKGKTFSLAVRWSCEPIVRKPITAISLGSGAPRLTVVGHGLPEGWEAWVTRVKGMTQINASSNPPRDSDLHPVTVIDANTIEFNGITPVDASGKEWPAYTSGGFVEFYTPVDLTGQTPRMRIKDKIGGKPLASTDAADVPLNILTVTVDVTNKKIDIGISATATEALTWKKGVTDLEMVSATGEVKKLKLCVGPEEDPDPVRVTGEVTK